MSRRRSFQPGAWCALEDRVLLSHSAAVVGGSPRARPVETAAQVTGARAHAGLTVGALGDSYTDEYRFYHPDQSRARNWVEILAATRPMIDFGPFRTTSWGEPRNQGFAFNWARYDATSSNMIQNQLPGLSAQVAAGKVDYAWVFIGGNDFLFFLRGVQSGQIPASQASTVLSQVESQAAANVTTAVHTLLEASPQVRLIVATVPDVTALPVVRAALTTPAYHEVASATSQAIGAYNATIAQLAAGNSRIALVDLAAQAAQLAEIRLGSVPFGNTTINLTTPGDGYRHFFLADGIHIGTVGQGIIASDFLQAVDSTFGARVAPLSPQQIVRFARQAASPSQDGHGLP